MVQVAWGEAVRHIIAYSGGKDSTALVCWGLENLPAFDAVFCDTGWEHPITYGYIQEINQQLLGGRLITISNKEIGGMRGLVEIKKRVPSAKARFCTENLKTVPMAEWLKTIDDEVTVYQGIRRNESLARSRMCASEFSDMYDCQVERPLFDWTAEQCFALAKKHGVKPNPLYLMGASRVGCFPCVMIQLRELKAMFSYPERKAEIIARVRELEAIVNRSFFPPNYIPKRFHTGYDEKSGKSFPWSQDVFSYIEKVNVDQLPMLEARSCMSIYNQCE